MRLVRNNQMNASFRDHLKCQWESTTVSIVKNFILRNKIYIMVVLSAEL